MGRRKISLEPAVRVVGWLGLSVIYVSLCGPHSLETSTLAPTLREEVAPGLLSAPLLSRCWYLFHQLGVLGFRVCAPANCAQNMVTRNKRKKILDERLIMRHSRLNLQGQVPLQQAGSAGV